MALYANFWWVFVAWRWARFFSLGCGLLGVCVVGDEGSGAGVVGWNLVWLLFATLYIDWCDEVS